MKRLLFALMVCLSAGAAGAESTAWTIEQSRTTENIHGLYEIQQEAQAFLQNENKRRGTDFYVGEPNLKVLVPACAVPLKAKWGKPKHARVYTVVVSCRRAIPENYGKAKWDVDVSAFSTAEIAAHKVLPAPASR